VKNRTMPAGIVRARAVAPSPPRSRAAVRALAARKAQAKRLGVSGLALHQAGVRYYAPDGDKVARDLLAVHERAKAAPSHAPPSPASSDAIVDILAGCSTASRETIARSYAATRGAK
jgi:hypothetical protein